VTQRLVTTRRRFLQLSGAAAAFAALGRLPAPAAAAAAGAAGSRFFSDAERDVLAAVCERIVDTGEPGAPTARDAGAVARIETLCAGLDPALSGPLPLLLRAVEWGPFLFDRRFGRFTRLPAADQDASLRGWMTSRLALRRLGFEALRNLAFLGYYASERTWPWIGYAGPLLARSAS
jgi:hypothetical protein